MAAGLIEVIFMAAALFGMWLVHDLGSWWGSDVSSGTRLRVWVILACAAVLPPLAGLVYCVTAHRRAAITTAQVVLLAVAALASLPLAPIST
jgi:hypothetical protein